MIGSYDGHGGRAPRDRSPVPGSATPAAAAAPVAARPKKKNMSVINPRTKKYDKHMCDTCVWLILTHCTCR
jgi:hypothetical protein